MEATGKLQAVDAWLRDHLQARIARFRPVAGGCINETGALILSDGRKLFVKLHPGAPDNFFQAEAGGLQLLADATPLRVPQVVHADRDFLLLEDLGSGKPAADFWQRLGEGLAQLHGTSHASFGLEMDNFCGRTVQVNTPSQDGHAFFAAYRLDALAEQAARLGLLDSTDRRRVDQLSSSLRDWIPDLPAVLIHGDLWSGNVHCDSEGHPALIDPACYRGWAEAELAMTMLFGGFPAEFYLTYQEASGIAHDWRQRAPLYNLYHLLNHLLLFGSGYLGQVRSILDRYC